MRYNRRRSREFQRSDRGRRVESQILGVACWLLGDLGISSNVPLCANSCRFCDSRRTGGAVLKFFVSRAHGAKG